MRQQTRSRIANGLERTRLLCPAERLRERWLTMRAREDHLAFDGLPVPPARLRLLVDGRSGDASRFLSIGRRMNDSIREAVTVAGPAPEEMRAILDFGVGCGRVARHWADLDGPEIHGCDYNPELVTWCRDKLPFLRTSQNPLLPPAPYVSGSFDLIYALSVFSHLDETLQATWIAEFRRMLRPGGLLVISVLGEAMRGRLTPEERARFDRGDLVLQRPAQAGRNLCTAYHPPVYVERKLLRDFSDVSPFDLGATDLPVLQDAYIARRTAGAI
ncbi:MAG TPA: class I SAM-dependent methyltransferase [Solirubrobacterales bacterium]